MSIINNEKPTVRLSLVDGFVLVPIKNGIWELVEVIDSSYSLNGVMVKFIKSGENKIMDPSTPTKKLTYDWVMRENKSCKQSI